MGWHPVGHALQQVAFSWAHSGGLPRSNLSFGMCPPLLLLMIMGFTDKDRAPAIHVLCPDHRLLHGGLAAAEEAGACMALLCVFPAAGAATLE